MPGMNVRGEQYLNFTTEEAAAWLGGREVQHQADEDRTGVGGNVVGLLGAAVICIVLAMISTMAYAIVYGLAHPQMASGLTQSSIQSSTATAQGMRADFRQPKHTLRRREIPRALGAERDRYLPAGWSMGCLAQDQPLASSMSGTRIGTIPKGTRLLYQISNAADWRIVVSADGNFWGYMCIRPQYGVPERTLMRPEYTGAITLIHRLENGMESRVVAKNAPPPF